MNSADINKEPEVIKILLEEFGKMETVHQNLQMLCGTPEDAVVYYGLSFKLATKIIIMVYDSIKECKDMAENKDESKEVREEFYKVLSCIPIANENSFKEFKNVIECLKTIFNDLKKQKHMDLSKLSADDRLKLEEKLQQVGIPIEALND